MAYSSLRLDFYFVQKHLKNKTSKGNTHIMTGFEYQVSALRTENKAALVPEDKRRNFDRLLEGLMGINGEAGEAIDIFKKYLFQGHTFEKEHLILELGDICWYIALCASAIGVTIDDIFKANIEKLRKRYPDKFDPALSILREEDDI